MYKDLHNNLLIKMKVRGQFTKAFLKGEAKGSIHQQLIFPPLLYFRIGHMEAAILVDEQGFDLSSQSCPPN